MSVLKHTRPTTNTGRDAVKLASCLVDFLANKRNIFKRAAITQYTPQQPLMLGHALFSICAHSFWKSMGVVAVYLRHYRYCTEVYPTNEQFPFCPS